MKRYIWPMVSITVIAAIAAGISKWTDLRYWPSFMIVAAAILFNGFVATVEDDLPGGFNNPDGTDTPKYVTFVRLSVRAVMIMCVGLSVLALLLWRYR